MNPDKLIKYSSPTSLCKEPIGTQWLNMKDEHNSELYIQISNENDKPQWIKMGLFLEKSLKESLNDPVFMHDAMSRFHKK